MRLWVWLHRDQRAPVTQCLQNSIYIAGGQSGTEEVLDWVGLRAIGWVRLGLRDYWLWRKILWFKAGVSSFPAGVHIDDFLLRLGRPNVQENSVYLGYVEWIRGYLFQSQTHWLGKLLMKCGNVLLHKIYYFGYEFVDPCGFELVLSSLVFNKFQLNLAQHSANGTIMS